MASTIPARSANRLLIADTDPETLWFASRTAEKLGFAVACASNEAQLREEVARFAPTVILIDPVAFSTQEVDALRWLGERRQHAALIVSGSAETGLLSPPEISMAYGLEVSASLNKPLGTSALEAALGPRLIRTRRVTEIELRRAIDRGQLCTHYQPKVQLDRDGWRVCAIEALLRWDHPEYGLIYPDEFIELAEEHGLIAALTDYVLQSGIEQIGDWNRLGWKLGLSVNLSAKLFTDVDFADRMSDFLFSHGVAPEQLTLEITESAALVDPSGTLEILARLRSRGIGLALDDFGIGYSSLTQLYKLPFSEVKIDKTIGMEIPQTPAARMIVRAIVDLGHHLGLTVCCEGVENRVALEVLQQCGCDHAQGYLIARPMAAEDLAHWIRARANSHRVPALAAS
ncbi:MAG: EAL domain-containing response regulator [Gammaproteobacteria bacterium]|nr:EAL domain-containing response regulator [Gammaproteobacteria bacterium]